LGSGKVSEKKIGDPKPNPIERGTFFTFYTNAKEK
jgi:hypothetical protein